jgi:hypothetical protein
MIMDVILYEEGGRGGVHPLIRESPCITIIHFTRPFVKAPSPLGLGGNFSNLSLFNISETNGCCNPSNTSLNRATKSCLKEDHPMP